MRHSTGEHIRVIIHLCEVHAFLILTKPTFICAAKISVCAASVHEILLFVYIVGMKLPAHVLLIAAKPVSIMCAVFVQ